MAIPETQLQTWTNRGAEASAQSTHESIRNALSKYSFPVDVKYDPYLQGSYRNATNIRGDSDVDLVLELTSAFERDIFQLDAASQLRYRLASSTAKYGWPEFRADVLKALRSYYGSTLVTEGHKSIKVSGNSSRLNADVVVCITYRKFLTYPQHGSPTYVEGMTFWSLPDWRQIINFPKLHYANGATKNDATAGQFKPVVRMFKNARSCMVDRNIITADVAPSYFIECLLYNMPSALYDTTLSTTFLTLIEWVVELSKQDGLGKLKCQHGQQLLFGTEPEQWQTDKAYAFLRGLLTLWGNW